MVRFENRLREVRAAETSRVLPLYIETAAISYRSEYEENRAYKELR